MAYVGLVPGDTPRASGARQHHQGRQPAARRMLVRWPRHYQHSLVSPIIASGRTIAQGVTDIAWAAQLRLNAKFSAAGTAG
jgi:hypothetical protein